MFNGDFRRKPEQSLGGYGRNKQRDALLERVQNERAKREEQRRRVAAAVKSQAFLRGCMSRGRSRQLQREVFDNLVKTRPDEIGLLSGQLLFFYQHKEDSQRFAWLCKELLKKQGLILSWCETSSEWKWRLRRLLRVAMVQMTEEEGNIAMPLRLLEVFVNKLSGQHTFIYLAKKGYFKQLRQLFDCRVPPMMEGSPVPPVPLCLLELLRAPLFYDQRDGTYCGCVMMHFAKEFLIAPLTDSLRFFVLPTLAPGFPLFALSKVLRSLESSPTLLYSLLSLEDAQSITASKEEHLDHLIALGKLTDQLQITSESDDDDEPRKSSWLVNECLDMLNEDWRVNRLLACVDEELNNPEMQKAVCTLCHHLLLAHKQAANKFRILYTLAFRPSFLRASWHTLTNTYRASDYQSQALLIRVLARGLELTREEIATLVPPLAVFCSLFSLLLLTLHDSEFWGETQGGESMPFKVDELVPLITELKGVCLGLIRLSYPESRILVRAEYRNVVKQGSEGKEPNTAIWRHLFNVSVDLLRALHARDTRRNFCPEDNWIAQGVLVPGLGLSKVNMRHSYKPFKRLLTFDPMNLEMGPPLSTSEVRQMAILQEMPFVVPFQQRVLLFQTLVLQEKDEHQAGANFLSGPQISIMVRRSYLYEDAFEKLSPENEPELRSKMRVQMINTAGLDEAGVDGGGVFREFLSELILTAFDPNRGFFRMTADNQLYPNPSVHLLIDNFQQHYFFIGRVLGKALFENLLVELPLAEFFLSKLVGGAKSDVGVHQLASLDPVMYRNLISLKGYDDPDDVSDLNLDFTVVNNELGESKVEDLKPGGSSISVTLTNRIEYIHLIADYKLNKQIRSQCNAFKQGLADIIPLEWLQMFDHKEFQVLISGAHIPVNLNDLRNHTQYTGGYTPDHPTIGVFWRVVDLFDDIQRRQLLKFVTSCSRPPLLGFKDLYPPFCIQLAGTEERLPTASTCLNLLKLPQFKDEDTLKDKLLYAIQSGAGFELS